jgi:hypothetical protein
MNKSKCPYCGNTDQSYMLDNGCKPKDLRYTLLCVATIPAGELDSFDDESDGSAECGMQWEPNQGDGE